MKKLLFIPMLFACFMGMGQQVSMGQQGQEEARKARVAKVAYFSDVYDKARKKHDSIDLHLPRYPRLRDDPRLNDDPRFRAVKNDLAKAKNDLAKAAKDLSGAADGEKTIGKTIIIGNLEVAQNDNPSTMNWQLAKKACADMGTFFNEVWRLPNKNELQILFKNKDKIGGFKNKSYWSLEDENYNVIGKNFGSGEQFMVGDKVNIGYNFRCVRSF